VKLALATLALVLVAGCSIDRRSGSLVCSQQSDCDGIAGTVCTDGYCISGTLPADARPPADAFECPAACNGGCDTATSPITCKVTAGSSCPAGFR